MDVPNPPLDQTAFDTAIFWARVKMPRRSDARQHWLYCGVRGEPTNFLRGKVTRVTRHAWELLFGRVPAGHVVVSGCAVLNCVAPHHLALTPRADPAGPPVRRRLDARTKAAIVAAARTGTRPTQLAARYGVSRTTVHRILAGEAAA
jgi:hypothetical protein